MNTSFGGACKPEHRILRASTTRNGLAVCLVFGLLFVVFAERRPDLSQLTDFGDILTSENCGGTRAKKKSNGGSIVGKACHLRDEFLGAVRETRRLGHGQATQPAHDPFISPPSFQTRRDRPAYSSSKRFVGTRHATSSSSSPCAEKKHKMPQKTRTTPPMPYSSSRSSCVPGYVQERQRR